MALRPRQQLLTILSGRWPASYSAHPFGGFPSGVLNGLSGRNQLKADMAGSSYGPILSGIVGGVLGMAICSAWSRWIPQECSRKDRSTLLRQNRAAIWTVNGCFWAGIGLALWFYSSGYFSRTDWRGLGIGFGLGCASVFVVLPLFALVGGRNPREAFVAYAIAQKSPIIVLYTILALGTGGLVASIVSTVLR